MESDEELTILYFDIDNFKPYNDVYGFENGDKVIVKLADVLRKQATETEFVAY
ncbi:diguanylate cyclase [Psychrobacillus insolitus]|uniref:diguanylate cyclase n=1 Tax=Psychrobacillus insolitus TaxID=1461 RepID=UPI000DAE66F0